MGQPGGNQPPGNWAPQIFTLLLIAAGPGLLFVLQTFADNPGLAIALSVVWAGLVWIGRLIVKAWMPIEDEITKNTSESVITFLRNLRERRYRKPYLQHLIYSHRTFDVKGLSAQGPHALELERVFVSLNMIPQTAPGRGVVSKEPTPIVPAGASTIWEFLNAPGISHLVILGAPGSGKTTLLKFVAMVLAGRTRQSPKEIPDKLPVLLFLRDHAEAIAANPDLPLPEIILNSLKRLPKDECPTTDWLERNLKRGDCLIMLDGLDEVSDPKARRLVIKWVEGMMSAWHRNRFILTSRPGGYKDNPLSSVTQLEVRPFNREQIHQFVTNWYLATELMAHKKGDAGVLMQANKGAEELLKRIESTPDIAELAVNPLLLTMIASVHRFRSSLPGRRVELYAEMCDVFLGKRKEAEGLEDNLTPAQKQTVLQTLAYRMQLRGLVELGVDESSDIISKPLMRVTRDMSPVSFLRVIEDRSGILIEKESGIYEFSHKTFQEFLAAVHIQQENLVDELVKHLDEEFWYETIRLYCARTDATRVIEECLNKSRVRRLVLAKECLEETLEVQPEVRSKLEGILSADLESSEPARFRIAAQTKMANRLKQLRFLSSNIYYDPELISYSEFQLFLNERLENIDFAPDHWNEARFAKGAAGLSLRGVMPGAAIAFVNWLNGKENDNRWLYRLPMVDELPFSDGYWAQDSKRGLVIVGTPNDSQLIKTKQYVQSEKIILEGYNPDKMMAGYAFVAILTQNTDPLIQDAFANARALLLNLDTAQDISLEPRLLQAFVQARALKFNTSLTRILLRTQERARALDKAEVHQFLDLHSAVARKQLSSLDTSYGYLLAIGLSIIIAKEFNTNNASESERLVSSINMIGALVRWLEKSFCGIPQPSLMILLRSVMKESQLYSILQTELEHLEKHEPKPDEPMWKDRHNVWRQHISEIVLAKTALSMLEKRRRGEPEFEPFEGLRLVRERRKDGQG